MNRSKLIPLIALSACLLALGADARQATSALRFGQQKPLPPQMMDSSVYDDVVELDAKEMKKYLSFPGSKTQPIVRVRVNCRCDTKHNRFAPLVRYEDLWFGKDGPIGLRRIAKLPIRERDQVAIFINSGTDNLSESEIAACAKALVRLRLETMLNRSAILVVRVPSYAFGELLSTLESENFLPYRECRESISFLIPIPLETELGVREMMCFAPPK
jgi:hypothetical protein